MPEGSDAQPPRFHLKMRLCTPNGEVFASRWFRVEWGGKLHPPPSSEPWRTDSHGALEVLLDDAPRASPQGHLHVIDRGEQGDRVVWNIPLYVADAPPPLSLPWDPALATPPHPGASRAEWAAYDAAVLHCDERTLGLLRERWSLFTQAWDEVSRRGATLSTRPERRLPDQELWRKWVELCSAMALAVREYEAAFRLWNLADLTLVRPPSWRSLAACKEALYRAVDRFACRHELPAPLVRPLAEALMPHYLDKIKQAHDDRGPLSS